MDRWTVEGHRSRGAYGPIPFQMAIDASERGDAALRALARLQRAGFDRVEVLDSYLTESGHVSKWLDGLPGVPLEQMIPAVMEAA